MWSRPAASEACLSPFHYHRMFARAFGETPHDFLTRMRIDRAKEMLARDDRSVSAVGYSPSDYRKALRKIFPVPALAQYRFIPSCYF